MCFLCLPSLFCSLHAATLLATFLPFSFFHPLRRWLNHLLCKDYVCVGITDCVNSLCKQHSQVLGVSGLSAAVFIQVFKHESQSSLLLKSCEPTTVCCVVKEESLPSNRILRDMLWSCTTQSAFWDLEDFAGLFFIKMKAVQPSLCSRVSHSGGIP